MLTESQLHRIEERLLEERERALRDLNQSQAGASAGLRERAGDISGADEGSETGDEEVDTTLAEREIGELALIDAALERLYKRPAEFGRDARTGGQIPFERLELVPWATS